MSRRLLSPCNRKMKKPMRNWKNSGPRTCAPVVRSTVSAVLLRLLSLVITGVFVLSGASCRSAKTMTQASSVSVVDSLRSSAANVASLKTAGGTPSTGNAKIRISIEPVPEGVSPVVDLSPDSSAKGALSVPSRVLIEAEASGCGGRAPSVDAASGSVSDCSLISTATASAEQSASTGDKGPSGWRKARDALFCMLLVAAATGMTTVVWRNRADKTNKANRADRTDKADRADKSDKADKADK